MAAAPCGIYVSSLLGHCVEDKGDSHHVNVANLNNQPGEFNRNCMHDRAYCHLPPILVGTNRRQQGATNVCFSL